jgi:putative sterol carrier protein/ferredoxin
MNLEEHPTVIKYRQSMQTKSVPSMGEPLDAEWLRELCLECGADDAGFTTLDANELAPWRSSTLSLLPGTKSLASLIIRLNPANIRSVSRAVSDAEYAQGFEKVNAVSREIALKLLAHGVKALFQPAGFPMETQNWPGRMWRVSHKTVAEAAGMGVMGLHRILIHPKFGSFVVLGTLLLDRELTEYGHRLDYNPCIDCKLCSAVCPVGAIGKDGHFSFATCMTHNYRDRVGGFVDWVEKVAGAGSVRRLHQRVKDSETVSVWQSLSYGICNKSSYCMAVCPAGEDLIGDYLEDRKGYVERIMKPLAENTEPVYVLPNSDGLAHVRKRFPHKQIRQVGNGLRPDSAKNFLSSLPLVFNRNQSEGLDAVYHFTFKGVEETKGTVIIKDKKLKVMKGHQEEPTMRVIAREKAWLNFLAGELNLAWALLSGKIRLKGSPQYMKRFAACFPS